MCKRNKTKTRDTEAVWEVGGGGCNRSVDERFSQRKRDQRRKRGEGAMARDSL